MASQPGPGRCQGAAFSRDQLAAGLRQLGLRPGQDLLIHASLRQLGRVDGGAGTLLAALQDVAEPAATLVVPAQTAQNSLSSGSFLRATARLNDQERAEFIAAMPGFDPATTPSAGMGVFAEYVRTRPAAIRSGHPQTSFAVIGPGARACMAAHDLDCHLGERSPLGWLYAADAAIVLAGVGYSACTAFHLAEYRLPGVPRRLYHCFTAQDGGIRAEHEFADIDLNDSDFEVLGMALELTCPVRHGQVGAARCRLLPLRAAVDFACTWMLDHRKQAIS